MDLETEGKGKSPPSSTHLEVITQKRFPIIALLKTPIYARMNVCLYVCMQYAYMRACMYTVPH